MSIYSLGRRTTIDTEAPQSLQFLQFKEFESLISILLKPSACQWVTTSPYEIKELEEGSYLSLRILVFMLLHATVSCQIFTLSDRNGSKWAHNMDIH